jgi:hypothetical protein
MTELNAVETTPIKSLDTKSEKNKAFRTLLKNQSLLDSEFSKKIRQKEIKVHSRAQLDKYAHY